MSISLSYNPVSESKHFASHALWLWEKLEKKFGRFPLRFTRDNIVALKQWREHQDDRTKNEVDRIIALVELHGAIDLTLN